MHSLTTSGLIRARRGDARAGRSADRGDRQPLSSNTVPHRVRARALLCCEPGEVMWMWNLMEKRVEDLRQVKLS